MLGRLGVRPREVGARVEVALGLEDEMLLPTGEGEERLAQLDRRVLRRGVRHEPPHRQVVRWGLQVAVAEFGLPDHAPWKAVAFVVVRVLIAKVVRSEVRVLLQHGRRSALDVQAATALLREREVHVGRELVLRRQPEEGTQRHLVRRADHDDDVLCHRLHCRDAPTDALPGVDLETVKEAVHLCARGGRASVRSERQRSAALTPVAAAAPAR